MGKRRLEKIKDILLNGDVINDKQVVFSIEQMETVISELKDELKVQNRSEYNAKYYKKNKETIDKRSLAWYYSNVDKAKENQKKYREKVN